MRLGIFLLCIFFYFAFPANAEEAAQCVRVQEDREDEIIRSYTCLERLVICERTPKLHVWTNDSLGYDQNSFKVGERCTQNSVVLQARVDISLGRRLNLKEDCGNLKIVFPANNQ